MNQVIKIDEGQIQQHLGETVRLTAEETLNAMVNAEADHLCHAQRCERTEARTDQRASYCKRRLHTKTGQVELKVPKFRRPPFETGIINRYRRLRWKRR